VHAFIHGISKRKGEPWDHAGGITKEGAGTGIRIFLHGNLRIKNGVFLKEILYLPEN
jgi:hypothetical protein